MSITTYFKKINKKYTVISEYSEVSDDFVLELNEVIIYDNSEDIQKVKIGDGVSTYEELPWLCCVEDVTIAPNNMLSGVKGVNVEGNLITGEIESKDSSDLTASGPTVTVPEGYYSSDATKTVATATRANTTISVTKDDTKDTLTLTASNNQTTGYVTGANKTATKTVSLTLSGPTATMSDGTYSVSNSVATGSAKTPATTITKNPTISVSTSGKITASVSGTQSVTPTVTAGYVSSGTAGTITVSGSSSKDLTTKGAATINPSASVQTAVSANTYCTGDIKVAATYTLFKNIASGQFTTSSGTLSTVGGAIGTSMPTRALLKLILTIGNDAGASYETAPFYYLCTPPTSSGGVNLTPFGGDNRNLIRLTRNSSNQYILSIGTKLGTDSNTHYTEVIIGATLSIYTFNPTLP